MLQTIIKKNSYQDSIVLMLLTSKISELEGVKRVSIMMGTPSNLDIFRASGFCTPELSSASSNDMVIMLEVEKSETEQLVLQTIEAELNSTQSGGGTVEENINTLEKALNKMPDANIALLSIPGEYAALEIEKVLDKGLHAFVFSDNVPLVEEARLKKKAHEKGLLVMGPDCGTGIIDGVPFAFTNNIRSGSIGIVGASGTGIQEVSTLIHRYGEGVTHALGTGGRDLSTNVGAISMIDSIVALNAHDETKVIVVISKPPAKEVEKKVLDVLRKVSKPVVTLFLGNKPLHHEENLYHAYTLEETAQLSVKALKNEAICYTPKAIKSTTKKITGQSIRGFYSGGTLAYEAAILLRDTLNIQDEQYESGYTLKTTHHEIIDLGDDQFTQGKPHPMMDPEVRTEKLWSVLTDHSIGLVVFDIVLGYGAHPDMANVLKETIVSIQEKLEEQQRVVEFIAVLVGTDLDPQGMDSQRQILENIGVVVCENNVQAICTALSYLDMVLPLVDKKINPRQKSHLEDLPEASHELKTLISEKPRTINIGLQSFTHSLTENNASFVHYNWRPSAGGNVKLQKVLYFLNNYQFDY